MASPRRRRHDRQSVDASRERATAICRSTQAEGVCACRFNAQFDDTLCYSRNDRDELLVKTGDHDPKVH